MEKFLEIEPAGFCSNATKTVTCFHKWSCFATGGGAMREIWIDKNTGQGCSRRERCASIAECMVYAS